ncbi:MAG: hypothetical protein COU11_04740 [Candidatus Harrisonbacteria bacterium CG10_big_fil_rev_8_21_14_0_10_49_15]|uniref:Uncharacterized protein n=1 Tax=Candidatus Harrisonbacteria bacterium CG10_big_fil_rev_8_21_14_0_10_49_15 TaxID=1974587 RepID=A0A2H0UJN9_9BACT|nr:MAG: hypothetical protein COU11_04740 [Candidatus Harrisonbacteria bacterium CG10_big_fil_rev_8_21_14_0_10_49_15]
MKQENVWIRLAGNARQIKLGATERWRFIINREAPEIQVTNWRVLGITDGDNFIPGTDPEGKEFGFVAWIDMYGDVFIEDGVAHITLKEAPENPSS